MKRILAVTLTTLLTASAFAGDLLQWQDNSLTFLAGKDFKLDPEVQQTLTFEHASGWSMGDLFIFVDGIYFDGDRDYQGNPMTYYGEIAPRFSAGKILDKDLSAFIFKDVLLATCYEFGENTEDNYLIGAGVDLDLPGFDFAQINVYRRFESHSQPENYQVTPVWKITFPMGDSSLICDGFIDWVIGEETDNLHICPQVKFDIGVFLGLEEKSLLAGIEYDYWKNKYGVEDGKPNSFGGINDSDQSAWSGIVQYHF